MPSLMSLTLFGIVLVSTFLHGAPALAQSNIASVAYDDATNLESEIGRASANICADAPISSVPAIAVEAANCTDCASASPLAAPKDLKRIKDELEKDEEARIRRDLAFFRMHDERFGGPNDAYLYQCNSLEKCEFSINDHKKNLEEYQKTIELLTKAAPLAKQALAEITNRKKHPKLSPELVDFLKELHEPSLVEMEKLKAKKLESIAKIEQQIKDGFLMQGNLEYEKKSLAENEASMAETKNYIEWLLKETREPPPEERYHAQVVGSFISLSQQNSGLLFTVKSQMEATQKAIVALEAKVKALKSSPMGAQPAPVAPVQYPDTPEGRRQELKALEAKYRDMSLSTAGNPGFAVCGMTMAEQVSLISYTGSGYSPLNRALRDGGEDAELYSAFRDTLNGALAKLRSFQGLVKRGGVLPEKILPDYEVGKVVTMPAYTSTSLGAGFKAKHIFVIKSKTGRFIAPYSAAYTEYEVLFRNGTHFKVLAREEKANGDIKFVLEEVDP